MHLDHGPTADLCYKSIQLGYSSVMIDGSLKPDMKTPASLSYNIDISKKTVAVAHTCGVSVEGEIGCLGSIEKNIHDKSILLTNPEEAKTFVDETKVDALAIAIGTSHGAYKFKKPPSKETLSIETVKNINKVLPNTHLVIHGASEVSKELLEIINNNDGYIPETYGVPIKEIENIIQYGVRKINIDTDLRLAYTAAIRQYLKKNKSIYDMRKYNIEAINHMKEICINRFEAFRSAGNGDKIKALSLIEMSQRYI
jgi:fructose-bisphosphate aldolase class II